MKFYFSKNVEGSYYAHDGNPMFGAWLTKDVINILEIKLHERFENFNIIKENSMDSLYDGYAGVFIIFENDEDEAAFLLWTNDGIEI
jgi:hypothetical protein